MKTLIIDYGKKEGRALFSAMGSFVYPSFCLHCHSKVNKCRFFLCEDCVQLLEWLDSRACCHCCFSPWKEEYSSCLSCQKKSYYLYPHQSLFLLIGPIATLWEFFCRRKEQSLVELFAALALWKWARSDWPLPDVIIPIPASRVTAFFYKKQIAFLLAEMLAKWLHIPLAREVIRLGDDQLALREKCVLADKKVLLLLAELPDSETLYRAKMLLQKLFPKTIYSLAIIDRR